MKKNIKTRIPAYISCKTKIDLENLKYEIWKNSGNSVSLTQIIRDAIDELLENHREELIKKYSER